MNTLFKPDTLANEFATNGYVVLDFLSRTEVKEISALFQKYKARAGNYHIYSNLEDNGLDTNIAIENKISALQRVVRLALVSQQAEITHYVKHKNTGEILKVVCDKEIFNISKGNMPERLNVLETISYKESFTITEDVFFQKLNVGYAAPQ